ncbi:MAG: DNA-3-methyladenine glycosylase [Candidatus Velthaea sp.]
MTLVRRLDDGTLLSGRVVETEAYEVGDPSSHAFRGATPRNRSMFAGPMHAYVYLIYGTAYCLNISSEIAGSGAAVLIRAVEPLGGIDTMRERRGARVADRDLTRGPGRLCAAFDIDRALDGADLETDERLWLAAGQSSATVGESTRIGLTKAAERLHRFYARGSTYLSGRKSLSP